MLHLLLFSPILKAAFSPCLVSFVVQKFLIRSHLFIFAFISITLGGGEDLAVIFMSEIVLPMFSSRNFIVSGLTFRSLIHFEFIFAPALSYLSLVVTI